MVNGPGRLVATPEDLNPAEPLFYDSEFLQNQRFHNELALIQLNQRHWAEPQFLDPLRPLDWRFISEHQGPLVVHGGHTDLDLIWFYGHTLPARLHDTQLGFQLLRPARVISYKKLVERFLHVSLDKDSIDHSAWLQRPLQPEQLHYAGADVHYLALLYPLLVAELAWHGRLGWWEEEGADLLAQRRAFWFRWYNLSNAHLLGNDRPVQVIAHILTEARERLARDWNLLRTRILSDDHIIRIATFGPRTAAELLDHLPLRCPLANNQLDFLLDSFAQRKNLEIPPRPNFYLSSDQHGRYLELKDYAKGVAKELNIYPGMLAPESELMRLLLTPEQSSLSRGWRRPFFQQFL